MTTKTCTKCKQEKDLTDFGKRTRSSDGINERCKSCVNESSRLTYAKDPQKSIARTRQYHLDNPEWSKIKLREHHERNAEVRYERQKDRLKNPEIRAKARESSRRSEARRRAIKAAGIADFVTAQQITQLVKNFSNRCFICSEEFDDIVELQIDHYMPIAKGGLHELDNLRPACSGCNRRKNSIWPITEEILIRIKNATLNARERQMEKEVMPLCQQ
jgi:5-methylcytosine-specific restriction endonuclease McrA